MTIAVTGVNGFIGSYLVESLTKNQALDVISISRRNGHDITDFKTLTSIEHFDIMIHLAAVSYVPESYENPYKFYNTNVTGTLNVLELTRRNKARIIFISSYVYGAPEYQPIDEQHPIKPFNPYAQSKILAEELCRAYFRDFHVSCTIFRPFNIYGKGQPNHFLIPKVTEQFKHGEVSVFDSRPRRDYIHVMDVVRAIQLEIFQKNDGLRIYNLGSGKSSSVLDICSILEKLSYSGAKINNLNKPRPNEILDTICNSQLAFQDLGWRPQVSFEEGLKEML